MTTAYGSDLFSYNDRGRMMGVTVGSTTTSYLYNALGQLIEKATGSSGNVYMYDESGHILGEYDGSGNLIEETVWLGDIPVATLQPSGSSISINYVHTDHLNTPRKVTRSSDNALEWRIDQDPFGTAPPNQNPNSLGTFVYNLRFPGQLYMPETGLNYNYFRDYDPQVGRYVESDLIGLTGGVNTYGYVGGNPISRRDPFGLKIVINGDPADYNTATAYLNQNAGMAQIIQDLNQSSTVYNIQYINDGNDQYDPSTKTIFWDPHSALCATSGGSQTPALGLGHEMAHADAGWWDQLIGWIPWPSYDNLEERRVITGPETYAAQTLGEAIRTDHGGTPYNVPTPISR
jgi:RHS repeat-associated protein